MPPQVAIHLLCALEAKTRIRALDLIQEVRNESGVASTWIPPKGAIYLARTGSLAVLVAGWG